MKFLVLTVFACILCDSLAKNDAASDKFINGFAKMLRKNDPEFLEIANIPQAKTFKKCNKVVKKFLLDRGATNAEEIVKTKCDIVNAKNHDHITPYNLATLFGSVIASGLEKIGKLNEDNASELASEAAQDFHTVISNKDISSPEAKMESLFEGYDKFFGRFGTSYIQLADTLNKADLDYVNSA